MTEERPTIQVTVAAPVDAVWAALRDKKKIRHWHGWEFTGGPDGSLEQEIDLIYFTDVTVADHTIALNGGDHIELTPVDGGTRVTLTRAPRGDDPDWASYHTDITDGWITFLNQLRFAVERHPDDARRTVILSGHAKTSPMIALGATGLQPGEPYELAFPGQTATGQVWYRSQHQLGLTVDGWNDGLLALSHNPGTGASMALLSLYGVEESRHTELTKQWHEWWTDTVVS